MTMREKYNFEKMKIPNNLNKNNAFSLTLSKLNNMFYSPKRPKKGGMIHA